MRPFFRLTNLKRPPNSHAAVASPTLIGSAMSTSSSSGADPSPTAAAGCSAFALRQKKEEDSIHKWRTSMSTKLSHAGLSSNHDNGSKSNYNNPLSPPLDLATTFERPPSGDYGDGGLIYSRSCNPTRKLLEDAVGQLEMMPSVNDHDSSCLNETIAPTFAFSSGMAAVASVLLACKSPVKLLIPEDVYHGVPTQLHSSLNDHGVAYESVDMTDCNVVQQKMKENIEKEGTLVVWMESPSNPLCQVTDIQEVCNAVHEIRIQPNENNSRILTVVDSTWAPPCITRPLSLGADAVLHSGTKYLGGHSDVLLGIASCSPMTENGLWLAERLKAVQTSIGAVASPFDCWLTLRGLRTLHLRVERQCQTAMKLAEYLNEHQSVMKCHYPGLESHPQHAVAKQQMVGQGSGGAFGGMLSFEVESESMAMAVAGAVRTIRRATSLGGTETLIEHRASIEPPERRTSPVGLLRLSVGLED
eukprot:CAMPEP_0172320326 /NCGR_PEP_ID=MMETSP1058-20130122/40271_1 /TAXON_ID=83371 /ORGANISM="Detonula confervacea, Strain CCMP 353" /LENGTH=472 /DNA_ID=CAMNT_0013035565 /DNA_START=76 /DNA_END=1491 /DNA_ORIENTATION=+